MLRYCGTSLDGASTSSRGMLWHQAWTLYTYREKLCEKLHSDIKNVADHLHTKMVLCVGSEYARITHHHLTGYEKVTRLLQVLAKRACLEHEKDFIIFCDVLTSELNLHHLATELKDFSRHTCVSCSSAKEMDHKDTLCTWIAKDTTSLYTPDISSCVKKYREHLKLRCRNIRKQTALTGVRTGRSGMQDVCQFFTSVQAMTLEEANRYANEEGSLACVMSRSSDKPGAGAFQLRDPVQILRPGPQSAQSHPEVLIDSSLLISDPGSGKTSVCQMLLAEYESDESLLSKTHPFPIYLPCRDVNRLCSGDWKVVLGLDDDKNLRFTPHEQEEVLEYLLSHSKQLLFIIDGLDEAGNRDIFEETGCLSEVISNDRKAFLGATVFLTSRPCKLASRALRFCEAHYTLAGFNDDQLSQFFEQNLGAEPGRRCMSELQLPSLNHMKETARATPLFATMICEVFRTTDSIPLCSADLYTQFITSLGGLRPLPQPSVARLQHLTRYDSDNQYNDECTQVSASVYVNGMASNPPARSTESSPSIAHASLLEGHIRELGELALRYLRLKVYEIPASVIPEDCRHAAINLGIMTPIHCHLTAGTDDECLSFLHVTFQEYFAARGIAMSLDPVAKMEEVAADIGVTAETWPVWLFVCGMVSTSILPDVIELLKERRGGHRNNKPIYIRSLLLCLLEGWHHAQNSCSNTIHAVDDAQQRQEASVFFKKAATKVAESELDLSKAEVSGVSLIALELLVELHPGLAKLRLSGSNPQERLLSSKALRKIKCLDLSGNKLSGSSLSRLSKTLVDGIVERLVLTSCNLQPSDASAMSDCMALESLQHLEVSDNRELGNAFLAGVVDCYLPDTHITSLYLVNIGLSQGCGEHLKALVEYTPHLSVLSLRQNRLETEDVRLLLSALTKCPVQELLLNTNLLNDSVAEPICEFFMNRRNSLAITNESSSSNADAEAGSSCVMHLEGNVSIAEVCMRKIAASRLVDGSKVLFDSHYVTGSICVKRDWPAELQKSSGKMAGMGLGDNGMEELVPALKEDTDIPRIDFGSCRLQSRGAKLFASSLQKNSSLKVVSFARNAVSTEGLKDLLAGCASQKQEKGCGLQAVVLSRNAALWSDVDSGSLFRDACASLARCTMLRCLILSQTDMPDGVAEMLFSALRHNTTLRLLVLTNNNLTDRTAKALVELKSKNDALLEVSLSNNDITDDGVDMMLKSPGIGKMLSVWMNGNKRCSTKKFAHPLRATSYLYTPDTLLSDVTDLQRTDLQRTGLQRMSVAVK